MKSYCQPDPKSSLRAALEISNADYLKELLFLLPGVKMKAPRKAELVDKLEQCLLSSFVEELWKRLDDLQQMAVRECIHDGEGRFETEGFQAKHGALPTFEEEGRSRYARGRPTLLRLFFYSEFKGGSNPDMIPDDLRERLLKFIPAPPKAKLEVLDELPKDSGVTKTIWKTITTDGNFLTEEEEVDYPLIQRLNEQAALQDLRTVLRLIEQEKIRVSAKTWRPAGASVQLLASLLYEGDYYDIEPPSDDSDPATGPIKCYSWPLLGQVAQLAKVSGSKLQLTKKGRAALSAAPEEILSEIWSDWLKTKKFDEFNRIDAIKGQSGRGRRNFTPASERRYIIERALSLCPTGKWVAIEEFSRFMRAAGFRFEVHLDPWKLYICEAQYGSLGYRGSHEWNILQERYLLCLLFEYAAPLGLIDLAYIRPDGARGDFRNMWGTDDLCYLSRYDGLRHFRLTPLGAYILGETDNWQGAKPKSETTLTVLPTRVIRHSSGLLAMDDLLQIENFAEKIGEGEWQLNEVSALKSIENGADVNQFRAFLEGYDPQPLPEKVESFLSDLDRKGRACVNKGTVYLIECDSVETADTIASNARTRKYCQRTGEKGLVVPVEKEKVFRSALNSIGFGMPLA